MAQQNTNNEGYDVKKSFSNNIQLVGFRLGEEIYATDVMKIEEIIRFTDITTVPRTDSFVLGVMNLRGKVIPVIDLRIRFDLNKFDFDKDTSIIVVNFNTEYLGFVVDSVIEVNEDKSKHDKSKSSFSWNSGTRIYIRYLQIQRSNGFYFRYR